MKPLIEFCEQNLSRQGNILLEDDELKEKADFLITSCLSMCELCAQKLFVMVEGEVIIADTMVELLEKVKRAIREWDEF
ncbi:MULTISPECIES: DUF1450 domain-containing protein [Enterococcus]|jgi:uncharacterized protein YuzB (UPF0349 family)|uniref:Uncharacterized protein n=1 Tax=Enterococcus dispar ATCC 51266 TaxID=1139219 RepID=S1P3L0_9ENTE|nr:DUF1450 domain-containing protein [Enterococcus dispar]EOT41395.1 hypothetical protein OMK_01571 [Enterococcus dispar ATCC 51266]EOW86971.1 hypothetical protein I569_02335 [Enterococcus dispar ATCC 51266]MCU7357876.1 DUF1450 domain-containing protein [Enterococcus dispar]MDT2706112.1 DUF1450 domain-containing protein [Enterococcus dispar]OJG37862.1 hypothetical protein RV01_GL000791 [Enterococcus dispar]